MRQILLCAAALLLAIGVAAAQEEPPVYDANLEPQEMWGTIITLSEDQIEIRNDGGEEQTFNLDAQTNKASNLSVGDRVHVKFKDTWGTNLAMSITSAGGPGPTAYAVHGDDVDVYEPSIVSSNVAASPVNGTVVMVHPDEIVIRTDAGDRKTFVIEDRTPRPDGLREGDRVRVLTSDRSGELVATSISSDSYAELPSTASPLPLIGLLGALFMAGAAALRRFSSQKA